MTSTVIRPPLTPSSIPDGDSPAGFLGRLWRGRAADPAWIRPALLVLLVGAAVLYLWDLSASGWANAYYSAAAQAGSESWKAFSFGSFDAANAITVDKTPAALWVMALSVRAFGLNSWSILVPEALFGVATVGVVYLTVRRVSRPEAGLIAGVITALTPVAVLMFRFNNPDALLVLLLVSAAYAMVRAQEEAKTRWLVLAGVLVGFGFLAKMLQALIVVPAFTVSYLLAAPTTMWRRLRQAVVAVAALVLSGGWWVAMVELWPAASRPFIGGSQTNSVLDLMFGYNGLGRLNGNETGSVVGGGGPGGAFAWGPTGWSRMFGTEVGTQVSWLIPAALVLLVAGLWWTWRRPRADALRASYLLWGGWLLGTGLVFSFMAGIFHAYYTVALAPAIGALVGLGLVQLWERRPSRGARAVLAGTVLVTVAWSWILLNRTPDWLAWLGPTLLVLGGLAAVGVLVAHRLPRRLAIVATAVALAVMLGAPAAYALETAGTAHSGSIPTAGPAGSVSNSFGPGRRAVGAIGPAGPAGTSGVAFPPGNGPTAGRGRFGPGRPVAGGRTGNGPAGGPLEAGEPGPELVAMLEQNAHEYRWVAAVVGANSAAGFQLAAEQPVLAIGGFNGTDPWPSLAEFQAMVSSGQIHYFITGGRNQGRGDSEQISTWVVANFTANTVNGVTLYDLTQSG